ncbi:EamA family transporter [Mollicutes bacterium LVI A0039]|nr:EamA family transporter [Mollicutes bacterium LVI A0039]
MNKGYIYATLSVLCMVFSTIINSVAIANISNNIASLINVTVVLVIIIMQTLLTRKKLVNKLPNKNIILMSVLNLIGLIFMFESVRLLGASAYSFISRMSVIFSLFIGIYILKEKNNISYLGILITLIGIVIMQFSDLTDEGLLGIATTIIFTLCFSVSNALAKVESSYDANEKLFYNNIISFVPLLIFALGSSTTVVNIDVISVVAIICSSILSAYWGMKFYFMSVAEIDFSTVTIIRTFNPVFTLIISDVIFKLQKVNAQELFGGLLILVGILLVVIKKMRPLTD